MSRPRPKLSHNNYSKIKTSAKQSVPYSQAEIPPVLANSKSTTNPALRGANVPVAKPKYLPGGY